MLCYFFNDDTSGTSQFSFLEEIKNSFSSFQVSTDYVVKSVAAGSDNLVKLFGNLAKISQPANNSLEALIHDFFKHVIHVSLSFRFIELLSWFILDLPELVSQAISFLI